MNYSIYIWLFLDSEREGESEHIKALSSEIKQFIESNILFKLKFATNILTKEYNFIDSSLTFKYPKYNTKQLHIYIGVGKTGLQAFKQFEKYNPTKPSNIIILWTAHQFFSGVEKLKQLDIVALPKHEKEYVKKVKFLPKNLTFIYTWGVPYSLNANTLNDKAALEGKNIINNGKPFFVFLIGGDAETRQEQDNKYIAHTNNNLWKLLTKESIINLTQTLCEQFMLKKNNYNVIIVNNHRTSKFKNTHGEIFEPRYHLQDSKLDPITIAAKHTFEQYGIKSQVFNFIFDNKSSQPKQSAYYSALRAAKKHKQSIVVCTGDSIAGGSEIRAVIPPSQFYLAEVSSMSATHLNFINNIHNAGWAGLIKKDKQLCTPTNKALPENETAAKIIAKEVCRYLLTKIQS